MNNLLELKTRDAEGTPRIVDGKGAGGEDAARAYVGSHPGCVVYAWRVGNRHGLFAIEDATRIHDAPRSKGRGVA